MTDGSHIYLNPENPGHLGDDTFWTWFKRVFPKSRWDWQNAKAGDVVLQYSVLGRYEGPAKYVALCWELYPEMQRVLPASIGNWDDKVARCLACAAGTEWRTVPTATTAHYYERFGRVEVIPLAVDTDVFTPLNRTEELRAKYGLRAKGPIGFWCGTTHHMKGFDLLQAHAAKNPEIDWIVCWKQPSEAGHLEGAHNTVSILQPHLNELMNCADFVASTGRLKPLFLVEWEAMASGLMLWNVDGVDREALTGSSRKHVFEQFWDRRTAKRLWSDYLEDVLDA
jgi:hypothetical protein